MTKPWRSETTVKSTTVKLIASQWVNVQSDTALRVDAISYSVRNMMEDI